MYPDDKDEVVQLYLDDIIPNRFQPREVFDEKALKELAVSIKEHGVIQPIIVRSVNGKYEIIAGERRYKASALAGLTKIPAIIRDLDDKESSKVALLENLQRKNLNPIEEARTYQKILEIDEMTQEELAKTMGKSQSAVANKIRLLSLPEEIQDALLKEQISERHARTLLNLQDPEEQKMMLKKVIDNKMSVRSLEDEIKEMHPKEEKMSKDTSNDIASSDFVNSSPLMPTAELPKDTSNFGKVTIAPPTDGEEQNTSHKFINYGEIEKDDDNDDNSEEGGSLFDLPSSTAPVDVDKIKEDAIDIESREPDGGDLDSLLNLGNPSASSAPNSFITPAEKIVKTDNGEEDSETISNYFQMPEFDSDTNSTPILSPMDNNMFLSSPPPKEEKEETPELKPLKSFDAETNNYTIEQATDKIRALVKELIEKGVKINTDEMNFEKSYQIIIKIDKTEEK